jgi:hypothetical protein
MDSFALRVALRELPTELQHKIVMLAREPPPAPHKPMSVRLRKMMERWTDPDRPKIMPRVLFT